MNKTYLNIMFRYLLIIKSLIKLNDMYVNVNVFYIFAIILNVKKNE